MTRRATLATCGVVLVASAAAWWVVDARSRSGSSAPEPEVLEPLATSPRPPIAEEKVAPLLAPMGVDPSRPTGSTRRERLAARNERAREHRAAVERYEAGMIPIRDVEAAEMALFDARKALGEIDAKEWHRGRVVLLERDAARAQVHADAGVAPTSDAAKARMAVEKEKYLAGQPQDYVAKREEFLTSAAGQLHNRVEAGVVSVTSAEEELKDLREQFPPAGELDPERDR